MAKLRVFAPHDAKLGVFMTPFFMLHLGQALRTWEDLCNDPQTIFSKHSSDFVLYEVGIFDDDTGLMSPHSPLQQVATAAEAKKKPQASEPMFDKVSNIGR